MTLPHVLWESRDASNSVASCSDVKIGMRLNAATCSVVSIQSVTCTVVKIGIFKLCRMYRCEYRDASELLIKMSMPGHELNSLAMIPFQNN